MNESNLFQGTMIGAGNGALFSSITCGIFTIFTDQHWESMLFGEVSTGAFIIFVVAAISFVMTMVFGWMIEADSPEGYAWLIATIVQFTLTNVFVNIAGFEGLMAFLAYCCAGMVMIWYLSATKIPWLIEYFARRKHRC